MSLSPSKASLLVTLALAVTFAPRPAHAWAIGTPINAVGCHEPITAAALRTVRHKFATAPAVAPSRDEAAMIADVLFSPPSDFVDDLAGMSLLLGVRDNDLHGVDPLASLDLVQVHGSPTTQDEHCIRGPDDDGSPGDQSALAACQAFIVSTATAALDGLDANGNVDATIRTPLTLVLAVRGQVSPQLPLFYVRMGAAMHALEDGFPHTYRTADGMQVTTVLNWIDLVGSNYDEARDGPGHRAGLDRCWDSDPTIARDFALATQAATELLTVALDPALDRDTKIAQFGVVTARYLTYKPGCTFDNHWCDPAEAAVPDTVTGCSASGQGFAFGAVALVSLLVLWRRRAAAVAVAMVIVASAPARADDAPAPVTADGKEPGRDVKTPTVEQVAAVRADKELGSAWGFAGSVGGSADRPALAATLGLRYRIDERWVVGLDGGWNPWITTSPIRMRAGVATAAVTVIRRFPMKFDRVNLRTSLHAGVSTLMFDVYGAPKYSTGPYVAFSPLGIDYDLGNATRIVLDPMEIALPVPLVGQLPLYYEQFRCMIGVQIGG